MKKKKEKNMMKNKISKLNKTISQFKTKPKIFYRIYNMILMQYKIYFLNYKTFHKFNKHLKHRI